MLTLIIEGKEQFDEATEEFIPPAETIVLELEHSLVAVYDWESKWEQPFLGNEDKTDEMMLDYVRCMNVGPNFPPEALSRIADEHWTIINEYISKKMTATWFSSRPASARHEIVTAEIIYYWMTALQIPYDRETWHLNRLLTLVKVVNEKNAPPKKRSRSEILEQQRDLNRRRRAESGSRG